MMLHRHFENVGEPVPAEKEPIEKVKGKPAPKKKGGKGEPIPVDPDPTKKDK